MTTELVDYFSGGSGRRGFCLVTGPIKVFSWMMCALVPYAGSRGDVFWLDGGNAFNPYLVARVARAMRLDAITVLSRIKLSRVFTAFQLESAINSMPGKISAAPAVVADPLALFYDDGVKPGESSRLFEHFLDGLGRCPGPVVIIQRDRPAPAGRERFMPGLEKRAAFATRLELNEAQSLSLAGL